MEPPVVLACLGLFCILAVILVLLYLRYQNQRMQHQERLAALEKGTPIPMAPAPAPWSPRVYLLRGLLWAFSGAALFVCLLGLAWSSQRPESAEVIAWNARNVSQSLNIPIDQARQMVEKDEAAHRPGPPTSIALLGLIPFGVGLAYLVFYWSDPSGRLRQ
ncbi:MAG TPA: DUF6249 domain-containing protein [Bryobacteraceae bacterium]|nr:DUF6249 domain-containing protein [Bryobacteraceae bacterium]